MEESRMLLIARRIGESIQIGPDIEVKILHASRSRVMVAVAAPRELKIWRVQPGSEADRAGEAHERAANETIRRRFKMASSHG
jgi:sRNA-binding carbon storage regulator CsrA